MWSGATAPPPPALWHEFCSQPLVQHPWAGDHPPPRGSGSRWPNSRAGRAEPWGWQGWGAPGSPPCPSVQRLFSVRRRQGFLQANVAFGSKVRWCEESKTVPLLSPAASSEPSATLRDPPAPNPSPLPYLHAINWECLGVTSLVTDPRPGRATCFGRSAFSDCYLAIAWERRGRACLVCLCSLQKACNAL